MSQRALIAAFFAGALLLGDAAPAAMVQDKNAGSTFTAAELAERATHRRAVEAVNWGMPAVNYDLMLQAMIKTGGAPNQIVYWSKLFDWKNQTLTPNPDTVYLQPFWNIKNVGPAGVDKGKGGRYLVTPPGYEGTPPDGSIVLRSMTCQGYALLRSTPGSGYEGTPPDGSIVLRSMTCQGYALLRSTPGSDSDADIAKAVAYGKRIKLYPLTQAASPSETKFVDAINVVFDSTIPYDLRFFRSLDRIVQIEPWLERDKVMIVMLKSIGIEKGKRFNPDARTEETLNAAAAQAHAWLDARYDAGFPRYFESASRWALPAIPELVKTSATLYETPDLYSVDARASRHLCIQYREAPWSGTVLLDDRKGSRRPRTGWRENLSNTCSRECAGEAVLVGSGLRQDDARTRPRPIPRQPLLAFVRDTQEPRRFCGRLTSDPRLRRARSRIGFRRSPAVGLKSSSASMVQRSRFSRRHGSCRISRR